MKSINISLGKMTEKTKMAAVMSWTEGMSTETDDGVPVAGERATMSTLPREQFMTRFRDASSESLRNAYITNHPLHVSHLSGVITSTLCEDVFTLVNTQWNVLHEYLEASKMLGTDLGNSVLFDGLLSLFWNLRELHVEYRDTFLVDLERCCATANDFYRMMETTEEFWATLEQTYSSLGGSGASVIHLKDQVNDLVALYTSDAVYAAQRAHTFVVREINQSSIPSQLFSRDWEDVFTSNEVVLSIIKTMEDYLYDFHNFLCNDLLYRKVVDSLIRAMVCFYITSLVRTADQVRRRNQLKKKQTGFANPSRSLTRMMYDLELFRSYFENLTKELPSLKPVVEEEMSVLVLVHECLCVAVTNTGDETSVEEFVIVMHKHTGGNMEVTRHFMGDLWFLAAPPTERNEIYEIVALMQGELQMISLHMDAAAIPKNDRDPLKGIKLTETLHDLYEERILQSHFSVCAPCVHAVKKVRKKGVRKSLTPEKIPLKLQVPHISLHHRSGNSDQVYRSLQGKLSEVLKLHHLNFVKKQRQGPKIHFSLSTKPVED
jgi:hypothetical protein